jgi:hypothetical protein
MLFPCQVRMKAPVQEYTVILGQREADFAWREVADDVTVRRAMRNLERDVSGVVSRLHDPGGPTSLYAPQDPRV